MASKAIVVGSGPAGLACAAMLRKRAIDVTILERETQLASSWRHHYDRLHLHTDKRHSSLPGYHMPRRYPRYPSRDQVVQYLEAYAQHHGLVPEYDAEVSVIRRAEKWEVQSDRGTYSADIVVLATGVASYPNRPAWPGQENYTGKILHSSEYVNPNRFDGLRVLVVGLGNSGGEIALDLAEKNIKVALSVRSPVNIIPKEVMGIPILTLSILETKLPVWLADKANRAVQRFYFGNLNALGLTASSIGPLEQVRTDGKVPLIDIGTVDMIKTGGIEVRGNIQSFEDQTAVFEDGSHGKFDAVILATGFRSDLRKLLPDCSDLLTHDGAPKLSGGSSGRDGMFFCSYRASPTGQLREIGLEANAIADSALRFAR